MTQSRHRAVAGTMAQDNTAHGPAVEYRRSVVVSKAALLLMPKPKGALHPGLPPVLLLSIGLGAPDHNVRQAADHGKPANTHYRHGATRSPGSRALNREQRSAAHTHKMWHTRTIKRQTCPRRLHALPCCGTFCFCNRAAACPPFTTRDRNPRKSVKAAPWHAQSTVPTNRSNPMVDAFWMLHSATVRLSISNSPWKVIHWLPVGMPSGCRI